MTKYRIKKESPLDYKFPFYYAQVRLKFLGIFPYWYTLSFSYDEQKMVNLIKRREAADKKPEYTYL
jgi:hypothetical protein